MKLPPLPWFVGEQIIRKGIEHQWIQKSYFAQREKVGPLVAPAVFQPAIEPEGGLLKVIFTEPGAVHLVFLDEIAPFDIWDEKYREHRKRSLGRTADIESIEIIDNRVTFRWCGLIPFNPYEAGLHPSTTEEYTGKIYSSTWNHMMANSPQPLITLRGGYREIKAPCYNGDRDSAEEYAKGL